MKHQILKKAALKTPGISRVLLDKQQLYKLTLNQKKEINKLNRRLAGKSQEKKDVIWPLLKKEILKAELSGSNKERLSKKHAPPLVLNWVVPAVVPSSGGQSDIFRTIMYLTKKGHHCRIYIYDHAKRSNLVAQKKIIEKHFPEFKNGIFYNSKKMDDCDAIFTTHWLTAYPVYNFQGVGKKYYFAQGYEPHTQPAGYLSQLAENTYDFGFKGIALGQWLAEKLNEYQIPCDYFDFGYDPSEYFQISKNPRKDVLYYAQPQKAHRGFELGIMALEIFHAKNPDSKIHLFGADVSNYKIPFPYTNHGILTVPQLNDLYNKCAAGLSLSFTNISLIPLEMIAAGCMPVINDANHTRKIKYSSMVTFVKPEPMAIARALSKAVRSNQKGLSIELPVTYSWDHSNQKIEEILIKDLAST